MKDVFNELKEKKSTIFLWQKEDESRVVQTMFLTDVNSELVFCCKQNEKVEFNPDLPLFVYLESKDVIFKGEIVKVGQSDLKMKIPDKYYNLKDSGSENSAALEQEFTMMISGAREYINSEMKGSGYTERVQALHQGKTKGFTEKIETRLVTKKEVKVEEKKIEILGLDFSQFDDKRFVEMRASERKFPGKRGEIVKVNKITSNGLRLFTLTFELVDLSQGGIGFIDIEGKNFSVGDYLELVKLGPKDLSPSIKGKVMGIYPLEVKNKSVFKIGVKFI